VELRAEEFLNMTAVGNNGSNHRDPEVRPAPARRRFSAEEKARILAEVDACTERGEIGAIIRREGIYSSYLSRWRRERDRGELSGSATKKRGPKGPDPQVLAAENAALERENERLRKRLAQAETIIEVQKKLSEMLGLELPANENTERA
jgi:transposase-like protein